MNRVKIMTLGLVTVVVTSLAPELCFAARDLTSAATTAVNQATLIAKAASVLGILAGAACYQIPGAAAWAQRVLTSGLIGAGLAFGGPSLLGLFRTIFGG